MKKLSEFKIGDFRRIGAAIIAAVGVLAPALGVDFGPEDANQMAGAWNEAIQGISAFAIMILATWSKVAKK